MFISQNKQNKCRELHLLSVFLFLITGVMCCCKRIVITVLREVKGGAIAVVEHRHLQVLLLVQRLLSAAVVGACVCVGEQGLHLSRLAFPVEAGGSTDAGPTGSAALCPTVQQTL